MVEPLDAQNMLSRTPVVEKTAAAQRENALLLNQPTSQIEKERQHQNENVKLQRETVRTEDQQNQKQNPSSGTSGQREAKPENEEMGVELVREPAETPEHQLDVTI